MNTKSFRRRAAGAMVAAAACACVGAPAVAQTQPLEVITVEAERSEKIGQTQYGAPVREIVIKSHVSYADLDLKTEKGVRQFEKRIHETAKSTCKEMDVKFPVQGYGEEECIKAAVDGAMAQAKKIVAEKGGPVPK